MFQVGRNVLDPFLNCRRVRLIDADFVKEDEVLRSTCPKLMQKQQYRPEDHATNNRTRHWRQDAKDYEREHHDLHLNPFSAVRV